MKLHPGFLLLKNITLGLALVGAAATASAQQKYSEGKITYSINAPGHELEATCYVKGDWSACSFQQGPVKITTIGNLQNNYSAVLLDVPTVHMRKAGIANPEELERAAEMMPHYAFTPTSETRKIGDYNCKKYRGTNAASKRSVDVWVTTDITIPANVLSRAYSNVPGVPVLFTNEQQGLNQTVTLHSITDAKVPADAFSIPADFEKVRMSDLGGVH